MVLTAAICLLLRSTPQLIWKTSLLDIGTLSPTVTAAGEILVGGCYRPMTNGKNDDGTPISADQINLYDLSSNGQVRWKFHTKTGVGSQPVVGADGTTYIVESVSSGDNGTIIDDIYGTLDAIRPDGKLLWSRGAIGETTWFSDPPVRGPNGTVYANDGSNLLAFGQEGKLLWQKSLPTTQESFFCLFGGGSHGLSGYCPGGIYAISFSGSIRKLGSTDGLLPGQRAPDSVVPVGRSVFAVMRDDSKAATTEIVRYSLYRFDRGRGRQLLLTTTHEIEGAFGDGSNLLLKMGDDTLCRLDLNGSVKWRVKPGGKISSPAVRRDGTIFVGSSNGQLIALKSNGKVKWRFKTAGPIEAAPTVTQPGRIYIVCSNGRLEAIRG